MDAGSDSDTLKFPLASASRPGSIQAEALLRRAEGLCERLERLSAHAAREDREQGRTLRRSERETAIDLAAAGGELRALAADLATAEHARRGERRRLHLLLDLVAEGCLVTGPDGVIRGANRAAATLVGRPATHLLDTPITDILERDSEERTPHEQLLHARNGDGEAGWDGSLCRDDGSSVDVGLRCVVEREDRGNVAVELLWVVESLDSQDGGAVRERELRDEVERMSSLEKVKSDYLNLVSHELRGPLGLVRGYVAMLLDGSLGTLPPAAERVLPIITSRLDQMNRLVTQMLDTARLEDSRLHLERRPADLREIARRAAALMEPVAQQAQIHLDLDVGDDSVPVEVDVARIETIVTNLIDNAVKYAPGTDRVRCSVRIDGHEAVLSVRDEGVGLTPEAVGRLFRRFGRVVTQDNRHISGTGLGLYLSRELARLHGGDIVVVSASRAGSTFSLRLPLAGG